MRDRAKSRLREAFATGAVVGCTALGVGIAVAATSPNLVAAPQADVASPGSANELLPPAPQVLGYSILRPSSLIADTPGGLRFLAGTGVQVTGIAGLDLVASEKAARPDKQHPSAPARPAPRHAPAPAPSSPTSTPVTPEPDFPGQGEEHRSETADPKRSEKAEQRAAELPDAQPGDNKRNG